MADSLTVNRLLSNIPGPALIILTPILFSIAILTAVRAFTTTRYRSSLPSHTSSNLSSTKADPPPHIPYTIPWLGHATSFLAPRRGEFWTNLFRSHPRATGACTLLLGGRSIHILFSKLAVETLFKNRRLEREGFNIQVSEAGFGLEHDEVIRYYGHGEGPDEKGITPVMQHETIWQKFLLEKKSVNELTSKFVSVFRGGLAGELEQGNPEEKEVHLYTWLQSLMFTASTTAFFGSRLLEMYPNLNSDFFDFDSHMLTMFFGIPRFLAPAAYAVRERTLAGIVEWQVQMQKECENRPADPDGDIEWDHIFGSRANRARQHYYTARGVKNRSRAGMDLGFMFGLSSNAIPATGWMLMHILDPSAHNTLLPRVKEELQRAARPDGSIDVPTLTSLPLLQSIFQEVLRLYVDALVTRELKEDLTLPLSEGNDRRVLLKKDAVIMAPSWLGHRDEALWHDPPSHTFHAERFLHRDTETGKEIFSTSGTGGKFFPFGGGKTICPGRVFAKQEVLASVAAVLLEFEIEVLGFVDGKGRDTEAFPGLRDGYQGAGVMNMEGNMRVKLRNLKEKAET